MIQLLKNKIIIFIATRYLSYFVQFVNSLLIAYILGPFYLGIWGFLNLILQYLAFGNFGMEYALNVKLSTGDISDTKAQSMILSNALAATVMACISLVILGTIVNGLHIYFFEKFFFSKYIIYVISIACLNYFNLLFVNFYRAHSLFVPISVFQIIIQLSQLIACFIFKGDTLIVALLAMMLVAHLISFLFFIRELPIVLSSSINFLFIRGLYKRGLLLLFYNVTFYFLMLSTRSIIGRFYSIETMGLFTFASTIATALVVGLNTLEFIVFPKLLNKLSAETVDDNTVSAFFNLRQVYMISVFLFILLGLIGYPLLLVFFKKYDDTVTVFSYLAICQIILSSGFGYSTLIIAKSKELFIVLHGAVAIGINVVLAVTGNIFLHLEYSNMALCLLVAFIYYNIQVIRKGRELLKIKDGSIITDLLPPRLLVPLIFIIISITTKQYLLFYLLASVAFIIMNFRSFSLLKKYAMDLLYRPTIITIKTNDD